MLQERVFRRKQRASEQLACRWDGCCMCCDQWKTHLASRQRRLQCSIEFNFVLKTAINFCIAWWPSKQTLDKTGLKLLLRSIALFWATGKKWLNCTSDWRAINNPFIFINNKSASVSSQIIAAWGERKKRRSVSLRKSSQEVHNKNQSKDIRRVCFDYASYF